VGIGPGIWVTNSPTTSEINDRCVLGAQTLAWTVERNAPQEKNFSNLFIVHLCSLSKSTQLALLLQALSYKANLHHKHVEINSGESPYACRYLQD